MKINYLVSSLWKIGKLTGNGLKTVKDIMHLLVIAQNPICIDFLCMSYQENVTLGQYYSCLSMFYGLHLAYIYTLIIRDTIQKYKCSL